MSTQLRWLLCNALVQPQFDYACSVGYPNLSKKFKTKLQILQIECVCFCLQLDNRAYVGITEFKKINCHSIDYQFRQCLAANAFKFFDDRYPLYIKDAFDKSCIKQAWTRNSTMKLNQRPRRTSYDQNNISFLATSVWSNLPNELKCCINLNTFKHKIKEYFCYKITQKDNDIYLYD